MIYLVLERMKTRQGDEKTEFFKELSMKNLLPGFRLAHLRGE